MKVVFTTPQAGPLTLALGTVVVWIPPLTSEALADTCRGATWAFLKGFHAFVVVKAQIDSTANNPPLNFLTFKTNNDFIGFTPIFFIE